MKKILFFLLFLFPLIGSTQVFRQYFEVPNVTTRVGVILPYGQLVKINDSAKLYQLIHKGTAVTDSLKTFFRNSWVIDVSGSGGGTSDTTGWDIVNKAYLFWWVGLQGFQKSVNSWQYEVTSDSQNNFTTSLTLASTSIILYNGYPLRSTQWSGTGTTTLVVAVPTKQYDFITIK
jgi:hypothetical protein